MRLRKRNLDLRFVLGVTIIISILLMWFDKTQNIGTNLLTEIIGVTITVFIINKIIERKEKQRRIFLDLRILREVQSIIASFFSIWKHLAWHNLPDAAIKDKETLFTAYPQIIVQTSIKDQFEVVSIHLPESWKLFYHNRNIKECFGNYSETLTNDIKALINDFKIYLEPELLDLLLNILESDFFKNMYMMQQEGTEKVLIELDEDVNMLSSYISPNDLNHFDYFFKLLEYSAKLKIMIEKFEDVQMELYQIDRYFIHPSKFAHSPH